MLPEEFAKHITEIIVGLGGLFVLAAKYKDVLSLIWRLLVLALKPVQCVWRWIKLARKIEAACAENQVKVINLEKSIADLDAFVRAKLSPNGGSSISDSIKRIENRQISSDARSNALLNDSAQGIFFCATSGKNLWVNRTYARILGCGTNELLDYGWRKFIKTAELERYGKVWQAAFHDGCEFEDEVEFIDVGHQKIKVLINVVAVKDSSGNTASYIGQVTKL